MLGFVCLSVTTGRSADWTAEPLPAYNQLFQRTNGWIGADGDFAVALTNGLTLWLFSDTFVGEVRDGHRVKAAMVHNSVAWQHGVNSATAQVEFFYGQTTNGQPAALIAPADGKGWFWLFDGLMAQGHLFLLLAQIESTGDPSVFGFRQTGVTLGEISNPLDPPPQWHVIQRPLPFARFNKSENRAFGSAMLVTNGFAYLYGSRERKGAGKAMILARAPERSLTDFATWEFRTQSGWSTNAEELTDLCVGMASEYSVSWLPAWQRYVLVCTKGGLSEKIITRTAVEPWGPWSAATTIYQCPEMAWDKQIFCYAAKAHPLLATQPDELILTYAANSRSFAQTVNDARLYWPRFVSVKIAASIR